MKKTSSASTRLQCRLQWSLLVSLLVLSVFLMGCKTTGVLGMDMQSRGPPSSVYVSFGSNIPAHVRTRLYTYLHEVSRGVALTVADDQSNRVDWNQRVREDPLIRTEHKLQTKGTDKNNEAETRRFVRQTNRGTILTDTTCDSAELCILLGNTSATMQYISQKDLNQAGHEGFVTVIAQNALNQSSLVIACDGNGRNPSSKTPQAVDNNIGTVHGAYTVLETLGFGFFHPLIPLIPDSFPDSDSIKLGKHIETPYWRIRAWHYHTEHPLELQDVLNGFNASQDNIGYFESWEEMLPDLDSFLEWLVANGQNRLEFIPLWAEEWGDYAVSSSRQSKFKKMASMAHEFGLFFGADVPIAEEQQHGWYMTTTNGTLKDQQNRIKQHIDWLYDAGFDFLTTENGFSEFTHPLDTQMLAWINYTANYASQEYGYSVYIKCHCSTGQTCDHYVDPRTGEPLNFNFLPMYATSSMGIMPHTVQIYAYDDPAPTYGNENFTYLFDFMFYELEQNVQGAKGSPDTNFIPKGREIVFHGETGYWVNYDIDVPLFLPIYGERRLADYRYIVQRESEIGDKVDGQNNFESGWEWGYWLSNVMTARAAWNPHPSSGNHTNAVEQSLDDIVSKLITQDSDKRALVVLLLDLIGDQRNLLIFGNHTEGCQSVQLCNGMAYLSGQDTWSDLNMLINPPPSSGTQPDKLSFRAVYEGKFPKFGPNYTVLISLLTEMSETFAHYTEAMSSFRDKIISSKSAHRLFRGLLDALNITSIRANQVLHLYQAVNPSANRTVRSHHLSKAREMITAAMSIVSRREEDYPFPVPRVAGWRKNPTVYGWGYLWTVHSLYYWWRDYSLAEYIAIPPTNSSLLKESPCYLNIINPLDVAVGNNDLNEFAKAVREALGNVTVVDALADCLAMPDHELHFPEDL